MSWIGWNPQDAHPGDRGDGFLEQLQLFGAQVRGEEGEPRDVPAWPRQVPDETGSHGIGNDHHDNGERLRRVLGREGRWRRMRNNDVNLEAHQFSREVCKPLGLPCSPSVLHREILPLDMAKLTQPLPEGLYSFGRDANGGRPAEQKPDSRDLGRLLRFGGERCGEQAPGQSADERPAADHWISSSARRRSDCGIVRPSALAVLRLITSSNLLGCSTGRSAGLAPLRILSTCVAARRKRTAQSSPYEMSPPRLTISRHQ